MNAKTGIAVVALVLLWASVGGCPAPTNVPDDLTDPGGNTPADTGGDARTSGDADDSAGGGGADSSTRPCPTAQESLPTMVPATYAVVVQYRLPSFEDAILNFAVGSAFAVGPKLLATNAHVVEAIVDNPFPVRHVLALRAGTKEVFEVVRAAKHPDYDGDPVGSPDVGVLVTGASLPTLLECASDEDLEALAVGDELALAGFPGDVNDVFEIEPGITVAQSTALKGVITSLRSFDPSAEVTPDNVDIVQHDLPTTPGTSGSPLVRCGKVAAVHNAGTVRWVVTVDEDGNPDVQRQGVAANNFGIHARYLRRLMELTETGDVAMIELPPPPPSLPPADDPNDDDVTPAFAGTFSGVVTYVKRESLGGPLANEQQWTTTLSMTFDDNGIPTAFVVPGFLQTENGIHWVAEVSELGETVTLNESSADTDYTLTVTVALATYNETSARVVLSLIHHAEGDNEAQTQDGTGIQVVEYRLEGDELVYSALTTYEVALFFGSITALWEVDCQGTLSPEP